MTYGAGEGGRDVRVPGDGARPGEGPEHGPRAWFHVDMDGLDAIRRAHGRPADAARGAGPDELYLSGVENSLAFFEEEGITATYFVVADDLGDPAKREAVRRVVQAGHSVASHGWSHRRLRRLDSDEKRREVVDSRRRIQDELGVRCAGFRAPGYSLDFESLRLVREAGYLYDSSLYPTFPFRERLGLHRMLPEPFEVWPGEGVFEVPLPDPGPFLPPFHPSYALYLRRPYFRWRLRRHAERNDYLTLLFHLTDFSDRVALGMDPRLHVFTHNLFSSRSKLRFLRRCVGDVKRRFRPAVVADLLDGWPDTAPDLAPETVLGISTTHETGACVVRGGRVLSAVSEERMSRRKLDTAYPPERSVREALEVAGVEPDEIDAVAVGGLPWWDLLRQSWASLLRDVKDFHAWNDYFPHLCRLLYRLFYFWRALRYPRVRDFLEREFGVSPKLFYVEHHEAHAASVYRTGGWDRALVVTADGVGDELAFTVSEAEDGVIRRVAESWYPHSFGQFYTACTQLLGFRGGRHEGKITGLSGHGQRDEDLLARVDGTLRDGERFRLDKKYYAEGFIRPTPTNLRALAGGGDLLDVEYRNYKPPLRRLLRGFPREDVAHAYQHFLEREVVRCVRRHWTPGHRHLALAGGVFANVKLNMALSQAVEPEEIFVFPNMGDGGLGVGAALSVQATPSERLEHVYLGSSFGRGAVEEALASETRVRAAEPSDLAGEVAEALAEGKIVARFDGSMEFGPRALGNRSILFHCGDPSVNQWLNRQLDRTEFMPFAPICLYEDAPRYFEVRPSELRSCEYMTLVVRCTDLMKRTCPAAVHVDGTARPQFVRRETNPGMYGILERYRELTGISCVINTSFNMHEEPIVRTPGEALAAFRQSRLDALVLGDFLVEPVDRRGRRRAAPRESVDAVEAAVGG